MSVKKQKCDTGENLPSASCKEATHQHGTGVKFYPKSGNVYDNNGKLLGKGILTGGVLEIINTKTNKQDAKENN